MKQRHFSKSTPEQVKEYKKLRKQGMSYVRIGKLFGKEHTSIMWWCRDKKKVVRYFKAFEKPKKKVKTIDEIREELGVKKEMDYADYLKKEAAKKKTDSVYRLWAPSEKMAKSREIEKNIGI